MILCAGDLVSYGGGDNEVIESLHQRMIPCVAGNYDYAVAWDLEASNKPSSPQNEPLKQAALAWSKKNVSERSLAFLRSLPWRQRFQFESLTVDLMHAGPASLFDWHAPDRPETLSALAQNSDADAIVLGHTHQPFRVEEHGTIIINPGAAGRALDGDVRAAYAVFDCRTMTTDFRRVEYDLEAAVRDIRASGMPEGVAILVEQGIRRIEEAVVS